MRIAHVTATFPPYYAGTGNVCFQMARRLSQLGHTVTVYTMNVGDGAPDTQDGFAVERLAPLIRVGNAPLLPGLLRLPRYDLVHLHYPFIMGAEMIWANRHLHHQPYVLTYHNELRWRGVRGLVYDLYQKTAARAVLASAGRILLTSADFGQSSPFLWPLIQSDPSRVVEIPNGVDVDYFHPAVDARHVRVENRLRDDHTVILFAGAMDVAHHLKGGVPELLRALAQVEDETVVALLVGGGGMVETYQALAHALGIGERVRFVGWVPHEEMAPYYSAADIVVQPAALMEAFGMAAVEAMACGKPVIVSNLPGARTVVGDGQDGLLVRPGDVEDLVQKMRLLVGDRSLRRAMGEKGRVKVEQHYAWDQIIPRLVDIYRKVVGHEPASS